MIRKYCLMLFRAATLCSAPERTLGHALALVPSSLELARGVLFEARSNMFVKMFLWFSLDTAPIYEEDTNLP
uniref:Putative secreted protein n=1 Tax=Ixodes ricinus TaxID=34613 RepID=A0A6B0TXZ0_IXORI